MTRGFFTSCRTAAFMTWTFPDSYFRLPRSGAIAKELPYEVETQAIEWLVKFRWAPLSREVMAEDWKPESNVLQLIGLNRHFRASGTFDETCRQSSGLTVRGGRPEGVTT